MGSMRTWKFSFGSRMLIGFLVAFEFAIAALLFSLPILLGGSDHSFDWFIEAVAVVMLAFGLFFAFALLAMSRTRISLFPKALDALVPDHHNRLLFPHFRAIRLPISEIRSVERRQEICRSFGLSTLRESLSLVTTSGERIGLFSNTQGPASQLPLDEIAGAIASAAGVAVTDDGTVFSKAQGLYGAASSSWNEPPLAAASATKARQAVARTVQITLALVYLTFIIRSCN